MDLFRHVRLASPFLLLVFFSLLLAACNPTPGGGGINAAPGITDRFNDATIHPLGLATVTASCQPGEQMLSGGWAVNTPAYRQDTVTRGGIAHNVIDEYFIAASYPSAPNSWSVTFTNQSAGAGSGDVLGFVHVECLSKGHAPTIISQSGSSSSGNTLTAACPSGSQVTGGGYRLDNVSQANLASTVIDFEASTPPSLTRWQVTTDYSIGNLTLFGNNVTAYAVCASGMAVSTGNTGTASAPAASKPLVATQGTGSATCASGQTPVGAGYQKANFSPRAFPITSFFPSYGTTAPSWNATVYSLPPVTFDSSPMSSGGTLKIVPLCATITG